MMLIIILTETKDSIRRIEQLLAQKVDAKQTQIAQQDNSPPEHVAVAWITEYLEIDPSTFYRNVHEPLLRPVLVIGKRPYYLKEDVVKMMRPHDKYAHIYSRYKKPPISISCCHTPF